MSPKITIAGKEFEDFENLPPEVKAKLQEKLSSLKNVPFAKSILKTYGMNLDDFGNMTSGKSDPLLGNKQPEGNQFGGSQFSNNSSNFSFSQSSDPFRSGKKTNGAVIGIVITVLILGAVAGMIFGMNALTSSWEETFALTGDTTHFDPIASVNEIRSHIDPNAKLSSIEISYIRSDGTMDLSAKYNAKATYQFYRELAQPPKDAPPVGAGGTVNGKWYEPVSAEVYEPGQWRHVTKMGGGVSTEYSYENKGIDLDRDNPTAAPQKFVDDPKCQIKDFWKIAIGKGAPADAVARVDYGDSGYEFRISDADISLKFTNDCKLNKD